MCRCRRSLGPSPLQRRPEVRRETRSAYSHISAPASQYFIAYSPAHGRERTHVLKIESRLLDCGFQVLVRAVRHIIADDTPSSAEEPEVPTVDNTGRNTTAGAVPQFEKPLGYTSLGHLQDVCVAKPQGK